MLSEQYHSCHNIPVAESQRLRLKNLIIPSPTFNILNHSTPSTVQRLITASAQIPPHNNSSFCPLKILRERLRSSGRPGAGKR